MTIDDKLNLVINQMQIANQNLETNTKTLLSRISTLEAAMKSDVSQLTTLVTSLQEDNQFLTNRVEQTEIKISKLESQVEALQKENHGLQLSNARALAETRKNFLIFHGVREGTPEEVKMEISDYLKTTLGFPTITPIECRKFGNLPSDKNKVRPTSVQFTAFTDRETVFTASRKVKHFTISVYTDRPKILRDEANNRRTRLPQGPLPSQPSQ
jgi:hypothetical protein